ncbi:MAG: DUF1254 domain-containing protein [Gemmatimonadales bacterium]
MTTHAAALRIPLAAALAISLATGCAKPAPSPADVTPIAEQAFLYGLPMSMVYGIMYPYAIDTSSSEYKGPFNTIANVPKVYTPLDSAIITPNSDTPYSWLWMDLRAEPMVICVPEIEKDRYYSVMLTSLYTYNFGYMGSRTTGNGAGCYMVGGPSWTGATPDGVGKVFISGTDFALATFRTQLFNAADLDNVKAIQAKYQVQPLSAFLGQAAPPAAPAIDWPATNKADQRSGVFRYLAFLLQFAPPTGPAAVEVPLRKQFASIGIEAGKPYPTVALSDSTKAAMAEAIKPAEAAIKTKLQTLGKEVAGWVYVTSGIGDRSVYNGDWAQLSAVAVGGILANDPAEAAYAITHNDADGGILDGSQANYTLTFPADALPPVNAFWSVTMYDAKSQLLVENPINRYLINSPMLPQLKKNADGSLTMYIQHDAPTDPARKANWLPAPNGPIYMVLRLYWPKEEALNGTWLPPGIQRVQ